MKDNFIEKSIKEFLESFPNDSKIIRCNMNTEKDGTPTDWQETDMGLHLDFIRYRQLVDFLRQKLQQQKEELERKQITAIPAKLGKEVMKIYEDKIINDFREDLIEKIEKEKVEIHDLPADNEGKYESLLDHEIVWDGNYYTCRRCGIEFVPAKWVNITLQKAIEIIKQI